MRDPNILLCSEITRNDVYHLLDWLQDAEVVRYLHESDQVIDYLNNILNSVNLLSLTHIFNQNGLFYMIKDQSAKPVGFARLIKEGFDHELVVVIGNRHYWHKNYGTKVIKEILKIAFLHIRVNRIIARIYHENRYSYKAFKKNAFIIDNKNHHLVTMILTVKDYLQFMKMTRATYDDILITKLDKYRLEQTLSKTNDFILNHELNRAIIVDPQQIDNNVITMNSIVKINCDDRLRKVQLVYPEKVKDEHTVSVLSALGTAILGYRSEQVIDWNLPSGQKRIAIQELLYQPEASGDYHL